MAYPWLKTFKGGKPGPSWRREEENGVDCARSRPCDD